MKIIIAPDSFKGSLSAQDACRSIAEGLLSVWPDAEMLSIPLADGGEGTASTLAVATGGRMLKAHVLDPLGRVVEAEFAILGNGRTAVVEMAAASGLTLLKPDERNPLVTSTYGTGQLIKAALDQGVEKVLVAIGGSATNDGGAGALQALGARLCDGEGRHLSPGGAALQSLQALDLSEIDPRLRHVRLRVACDVDNPLTGPYGASAIFGPQKGASAQDVKLLDRCLEHWSDVVQQTMGGHDQRSYPGAGAAGGLGFGLLILGGTLEPGIKMVLDTLRMDDHLQGCDLVVTGEGTIDGQTARGKTIWGLAQRTRRLGVPLVALVGSEGSGADLLYDEGVSAILPVVNGPLSLEESMAKAAYLLRQAAARMARMINIGFAELRMKN